MTLISYIVYTMLTVTPVWAALMDCTDWKGKSIMDGTDFNPKKEDPCYVCRCDNGQSTMCKTVSCAAPDCLYWRQIPGECCRFECLQTDLPDSVINGRENFTSSPPSGPNSKGTIDDGTMTDLGLRLAASTVTTFLILALLLFLLHRLRQRRMLMALRRYRRRHRDLDDSDNISYSPDFYGLTFPPPYEDPPPPYSPPKPRGIHGGDRPPPYEAIEDNGNSNELDDNGNQTGNQIENQPALTGSLGTSNVARNGGAFNFSACQDLIDPRNLTGRYSERGDCNLNTDITNVITLDSIQSQPYSFVQSGNVSRCIITTERQNGQISRGHTNLSEIDIGESTSSSDSLDSRDSSPVPTEVEDKGTLLSSKVNGRQSNNNRVESGGVTLSEDAETTVRQFLDHQFGNRNPNFPVLMSQSWTCPDQNTAAPHLGLTRSFNRNSGMFQESASQVTRSSKRNSSDNPQTDILRMGVRCAKCNNIVACKCNKVKTNGLLTRSQSDYTQNASKTSPREKLLISRNRNMRLLPGSFGARVSYVEPEETIGTPLAASPDNPSSSQYHSDSETNISYFTPNSESISPTVSQCEGLDTRSNSRRQELLRELRLSHLLFSPASSYESSPSPISPAQPTEALIPKNQATGTLSTGTQSTGTQSTGTQSIGTQSKQSVQTNSGVISNDAQYPETGYNVVQSFDEDGEQDMYTNERNGAHKCNRNCSTSTLQSMDRLTVESEEDNSRQYNGNCLKNSSRQTFSKPRNIDSSTNCNNMVPNISHLESGMQNDFSPNVNNETSAMKVCNDKDVSNFIKPVAHRVTKPRWPWSFGRSECNNVDSHFSPSVNMTFSEATIAGVPSVNDRANASQFYNCEHEDKIIKKSKKKSLHKRHSAGSFTGEKSTPSRKFDLGPRHSPKQKSATLKGKHLRHLDVSDNDQSNSDNASRTHFTSGRQYYRTIENPHHSPVKVPPITSAVHQSNKSKSKSSSRKSQPFLELQDDNLVLTQKDSFRHSPNSFMMSPIHHSTSSAAANFSAKSQPKTSCHSDSRSHSLHGKKSHKRSRSLGKDECYVGLHVGSKHPDKQPSQKSSYRKKKNRQSFPGTNAFHRELEHVLENQKQAAPFSVGKVMGRYGRGEGGMHAVTQV